MASPVKESSRCRRTISRSCCAGSNSARSMGAPAGRSVHRHDRVAIDAALERPAPLAEIGEEPDTVAVDPALLDPRLAGRSAELLVMLFEKERIEPAAAVHDPGAVDPRGHDPQIDGRVADPLA